MMFFGISYSCTSVNTVPLAAVSSHAYWFASRCEKPIIVL